MSRRSAERQLPGAWTWLRDVLSFLGGWTLIFLEVQRPEIRDSVLAFGGAVIGVPGLAVGFTRALDAYIAHRSGTGGQPSQQVDSVASP